MPKISHFLLLTVEEGFNHSLTKVHPIPVNHCVVTWFYQNWPHNVPCPPFTQINKGTMRGGGGSTTVVFSELVAFPPPAPPQWFPPPPIPPTPHHGHCPHGHSPIGRRNKVLWRTVAPLFQQKSAAFAGPAKKAQKTHRVKKEGQDHLIFCLE